MTTQQMEKSRALLESKGYIVERRGLGKPAWGDILVWDTRYRRFAIVWVTTTKRAAKVWDKILSDHTIRAMLTNPKGSRAMAGLVMIWHGQRCDMRSVVYE